jgi:hypothetical protein
VLLLESMTGCLDTLAAAGFDIATRNHALAILKGDFPEVLPELADALTGFRIPAREIIQSGGGQAASTMRLRDALYARGWHKHEFVTRSIVDGIEREAKSHEIDHVRRAAAGTIALEIEWNNKDPFFDRDLENFHRLHAQGAISLGILITRGAALQDALPRIVERTVRDAAITDQTELTAWGMKTRTDRQRAMLRRLTDQGVPFAAAFAKSFVADKFGTATTHWAKLRDRIDRGVGNPCPLLLLGLPPGCVTGYSAATDELKG